MAKRISLLVLAAMLSSTFLFAMPRAKIRHKIPSTGIMKSILRPAVTLLDNTEGSLELLFNASLGSVTVEVADEAGAAYQDSWQVAAGEQRSIPIEDWELGVYTLTVTLGNGASYAWEVELVEN